MFEWAVIGLLGLGVAYLWAMWRLSLRYRVRLGAYIALLLLDDAVRADHQQKLRLYITDSTATNAVALSSRALSAIENMTENWDTLLPGAHAAIWQERQKNLIGSNSDRPAL